MPANSNQYQLQVIWLNLGSRYAPMNQHRQQCPVPIPVNRRSRHSSTPGNLSPGNTRSSQPASRRLREPWPFVADTWHYVSADTATSVIELLQSFTGKSINLGIGYCDDLQQSYAAEIFKGYGPRPSLCQRSRMQAEICQRWFSSLAVRCSIHTTSVSCSCLLFGQVQDRWNSGRSVRG